MTNQSRNVSMQRLPGVPAGGIRTVGQIRGTNSQIFYAGQNGMAVALELLSSGTSGAPVLNERARRLWAS